VLFHAIAEFLVRRDEPVIALAPRSDEWYLPELIIASAYGKGAYSAGFQQQLVIWAVFLARDGNGGEDIVFEKGCRALVSVLVWRYDN
jgi:hypothetical protein